MTKKITIVALVALMLLLVSLPANAAVTATTVEVRGTVANASALYANNDGVSWDSAKFAGFWYDLKDNKSSETLDILAFNGDRSIAKSNLTYTTKRQALRFKVSKEKGRNVEYGNNQLLTGANGSGAQYYAVVGWMAEKYVAINGKTNKLAKLVYEQDTADKMTLTVGQTWEIGGGYTLTAQSIDARSTPRLAWFVLSKDGAKLDDKVIAAAASDGTGTQGVYTYYANIGGESNVPIFVTFVDSVFSGATSDMVQLKYTWLMDTKILEIKNSDMYGVFKVDSETPDLILKSDSAVSLSKDSIVTLAGKLKFRVADSLEGDVRFYPMVVRDTQGTWEVRGTVANASDLTKPTVSWNSANFAGFWYDLKDNKSSETLDILAFNGDRSIAKSNLTYTTKRQALRFKVSKEKGRNVEYGNTESLTGANGSGAQYYAVVGWMAEKYVAINGKTNKLAKLVYEQDTADKMTLTVGQTWEIGGGYTLTAQSIDARSTPRLAWFVLSKDGAKLDDKVIAAAASDGTGTQGVYTYYANIGGESNVPIFVTFVDSVFSGATSDMVQLKYTWLMDTKILEVKNSDMYGVFKVDSETPDLILKSDSALSLSKDSIVTLAGNLKFRVADSENGDVRFYPMVEYMIGEPIIPPNQTATPTATPAKINGTNATVTPTILKPGTTATEAPAIAQTTKPNATATPKEPGFEAVFAIAGLLAVAFLVLRQRK